MKKFSYILLISTLLTGCTAMAAVKDIAGVVADDKASALSVDAQIGDKEANIGKTDNSVISAEDNEGVLTVTSTKADKQFNNEGNVIIENSNTTKELVLYLVGILGWLLPDPNKIYHEVKSWFVK